MSYLLATIGIIIMLFSFFLMGSDNSPEGAGLAFMVGIILVIIGAIMANRNRHNNKAE